MKLAIAGGGPIGLCLALLLKREGYDVTVLEKKSWPIDKTCGQGIMPSGLKILNEIGIHLTHQHDSYAFDGINYIDGEFNLKGLLPHEGMGVERKILSQKLHEKCLEQKIEMRENTSVNNFILLDNAVELELDNQGTFTSEVFNFVFCCDGINSKIRNLAGNTKSRTRNLRLGAREHFDHAPWTSKVEVYWNDGIEAYITPVSKDRIEVAFLWYQDKISSKENLHEKLWSHFPTLIEKGLKNKSKGDFRGYGPFKDYAKKEKVKNLFFVGDAYCFIDGITGEGLSLGFKAAKLISKKFNRWNILNKIQLRCFYLHYTFMVKIALLLSRHKGFRKFVFSFLTKNPNSFSFLLKANDL